MLAVSRHRDQLAPADVVVVAFTPWTELEAYRQHLGIDLVLVADPDRSLYRRFGVGRGRWWRVYGIGTLRLYATLLRQGRRLRRPVEDTLQLGADVVLDADGEVAWIRRPRSPDERPPVADLIAAVRSLDP